MGNHETTSHLSAATLASVTTRTRYTAHMFARALLLTVVFSSTASAQWLTWTDKSGNQRWNDKRNWNLLRLPTPKDVGVTIDSSRGAVLNKRAELKAFVNLGATKSGKLRIAKGGELNVKIALSLGCRDGVEGTLVMDKGSKLLANQIYIGNGARSWGGRGRLIMNGGRIKCTYFSVLRAGALKSRAHVTLKGGVVNCWDFMLCRDSIIPPKVDIAGGKVIQRRNDVKRIKDWIAARWLIAYGGRGKLTVKWDPPEHPGCTVVTATKPK